MVTPIPDHLHTVTPRLAVPGADAIDFYARAFGAEQLGEAFTGPEGELIHVEIRIGDSVVMLTGDADLARSPGNGPVTAIMATYWEDVDAAWDRALAADRPVLIEAVVDPDVPLLPPFPAGREKLDSFRPALDQEDGSEHARALLDEQARQEGD